MTEADAGVRFTVAGRGSTYDEAEAVCRSLGWAVPAIEAPWQNDALLQFMATSLPEGTASHTVVAFLSIHRLGDCHVPTTTSRCWYSMILPNRSSHVIYPGNTPGFTAFHPWYANWETDQPMGIGAMDRVAIRRDGLWQSHPSTGAPPLYVICAARSVVRRLDGVLSWQMVVLAIVGIIALAMMAAGAAAALWYRDRVKSWCRWLWARSSRGEDEEAEDEAEDEAEETDENDDDDYRGKTTSSVHSSPVGGGRVNASPNSSAASRGAALSATPGSRMGHPAPEPTRVGGRDARGSGSMGNSRSGGTLLASSCSGVAAAGESASWSAQPPVTDAAADAEGDTSSDSTPSGASRGSRASEDFEKFYASDRDRYFDLPEAPTLCSSRLLMLGSEWRKDVDGVVYTYLLGQDDAKYFFLLKESLLGVACNTPGAEQPTDDDLEYCARGGLVTCVAFLRLHLEKVLSRKETVFHWDLDEEQQQLNPRWDTSPAVAYRYTATPTKAAIKRASMLALLTHTFDEVQEAANCCVRCVAEDEFRWTSPHLFVFATRGMKYERLLIQRARRFAKRLSQNDAATREANARYGLEIVKHCKEMYWKRNLYEGYLLAVRDFLVSYWLHPQYPVSAANEPLLQARRRCLHTMRVLQLVCAVLVDYETVWAKRRIPCT